MMLKMKLNSNLQWTQLTNKNNQIKHTKAYAHAELNQGGICPSKYASDEIKIVCLCP